MNKPVIDSQFSTLLANTHYENFPVASFLLPKKARKDIYHVYTFARISDDIADDPNRSEDEKMSLLLKLEKDLIDENRDNDLIKLILPVISKWDLDKQLFLDLLTAFKQDSKNTAFENFEDLIHYSTFSANPVGRIILKFFNQDSEQKHHYSDMICTGLQLINFWQDLSIDKSMKRFYVPQSLLKINHLTFDDFYFSDISKDHLAVLDELISKTESIFNEGKNLIPLLKGRLKLEIKLVWHSANKVLKLIKKHKNELTIFRPTLRK